MYFQTLSYVRDNILSKCHSKDTFQIKKQMRFESRKTPLGEVRLALNSVDQRANARMPLVSKGGMYQNCPRDGGVQPLYKVS